MVASIFARFVPYCGLEKEDTPLGRVTIHLKCLASETQMILITNQTVFI